MNVGATQVVGARGIQVGRRNLAARLTFMAALALVLVGCPAGPPAAGDIHLRISTTFDTRPTEEDMWNSGTITADGVFSAAKLDTMDLGVIYDGNDIGPAPWSATTQQDSGDFEGECNGSNDCRPCTGNYVGSWPIDSVDFTVQERGNGRYVIELWLGSDSPPKTGGCDPMVAGPVAWSTNLTVTLTGIGTATSEATVVSTNSDGVYTAEINP